MVATPNNCTEGHGTLHSQCSGAEGGFDIIRSVSLSASVRAIHLKQEHMKKRTTQHQMMGLKTLEKASIKTQKSQNATSGVRSGTTLGMHGAQSWDIRGHTNR